MSFSWRILFFIVHNFVEFFPPNHLFNSIYKVNLYKCEFKQHSIILNCCNGTHTHTHIHTRKILWLLTEIPSLSLHNCDHHGYWKGKYEKKRASWVEIIQFSLLASISAFFRMSKQFCVLYASYFAIIFNKHFWFQFQFNQTFFFF